jgi:hypothetical protein
VPSDDFRPSEQTAKVIVPLIGTAFAFLAALLSGFVVYYTNDKTVQIQQKLSGIQQDQYALEQLTKLNQFNRESERQYVTLVYNDLISKDVERQRTALSLLQELAPETGLKLLHWARNAKIILPQNQAESSSAENKLNILEANGRFRIFLHMGSAKGRPIPDVSAIRKALASQGFSVVGTDDIFDNYGPGVDYFSDIDKTGAESVAKLLTDLLPNGTRTIPARKQTVQNRIGTLGIWF